ncbi:hypothetical protein P3T76_007775 [Phytophthora citrophthora]|uniref:RxLR effector protein n=1 Tax=Phytophthora citrophthora TaxID=4793 RepID=A0AAD9GLP9_9STRA|nr:hypothetical protein P3T76_007775 [Phytophthora citrophthora]
MWIFFWSGTDASKLAAPHSRSLRKSEPIKNEERVFNRLTTKLDDIVDAAKFKRLKLQWSIQHLDKDLPKLLKSSQMEKLAEFNLNRAPSKQVSLIGRLTAKYGDDIVARALVSVERSTSDNPALLAMARQIREDQIANWLKNGETVPGVVSKLKFVDDESIFRSKALGVLEDFIKEYNKAKHGDETLLKTLTTVYGDESELVAMVSKARTAFPYAQINPRSVEKANYIEDQLIGMWKHEKLSDFRVMSKLQFSDDINEARDVAKNTVASFDVAIPLQRKQLDDWLGNGYSIRKVFSILKFKEVDDFASKLDVLDQYTKLLKAKNLDDTTDIFKVLMKGLSGNEDKLAIALSKPLSGEAKGYQALLFKEWFAKDFDPMNVVVKVFKIPEADVAAGYSKEVAPTVKQYTKFFNGQADTQPLPPAVRNGRF